VVDVGGTKTQNSAQNLAAKAPENGELVQMILSFWEEGKFSGAIFAQLRGCTSQIQHGNTFLSNGNKTPLADMNH